MKKLIIIVLLLVSLTSFSQSIWRNSELEQVVFEEINIHRQNMGSDAVVWDDNNRTSLPYSELLTSNFMYLTVGWYYRAISVSKMIWIFISELGTCEKTETTQERKTRCVSQSTLHETLRRN